MTQDQDKVLITGAAGFIGRHMSRHFADSGWKVCGVDAATAENAPLPHLEHYAGLRLPSPQFGELVREWQPTLVIHCAGRASVDISMTQPDVDFYGNTVITFEVLESLRRYAPACRFINLSSAAVYGNPGTLPINESVLPSPISPYGFHKWQTDLLCQEYATAFGLHTASLRIFSAYGTGLRRQVIWDICRKIIGQGRLSLRGDGRESRDFVHVQDIARALMVLAKAPTIPGRVYNLGSGREVSIRELANLILSQFDLDVAPEFSGQLGSGIPRNWQADISCLEGLGFKPSVTLEQGIAQFVTWCRSELEGI